MSIYSVFFWHLFKIVSNDSLRMMLSISAFKRSVIPRLKMPNTRITTLMGKNLPPGRENIVFFINLAK